MFKVSFKETPDNPSKVFLKSGSVTTCIVKGIVKLPSFWKNIPEEIIEWIRELENICLEEDFIDHTLTVYAEGVSRCRKGDKYNPVLGERLAEARAKMTVYKFMMNLTTRITNYYEELLYGNEEERAKEFTRCGVAGSIDKYFALTIKEENHLKRLLGEVKDGGEQKSV